MKRARALICLLASLALGVVACTACTVNGMQSTAPLRITPPAELVEAVASPLATPTTSPTPTATPSPTSTPPAAAETTVFAVIGDYGNGGKTSAPWRAW